MDWLSDKPNEVKNRTLAAVRPSGCVSNGSMNLDIETGQKNPFCWSAIIDVMCRRSISTITPYHIIEDEKDTLRNRVH